MVIPIRVFGDVVLRKKCEEIDNNYPELNTLIANMFDTMNAANGVGLAAPQIGLPIRLFIIDVSPMAEDEEYKQISEELKSFKRVFINAKIINQSGNKWKFNEGCLSIPNIREDVERVQTIEIEYFDENFTKHKETFSDIRARVIQHEYDHIEGILFTDYLSSLKKKLIKRKLENITKGNFSADYKVRLPNN